VWLAMKVAGQWNRWENGADIGSTVIPGRAFYNFFLIGTGFSIAYSVAGFSITSSIASGEYLTSIIAPSSLIIGTILFVQLTKYYQRKYHKDIESSNKKDS